MNIEKRYVLSLKNGEKRDISDTIIQEKCYNVVFVFAQSRFCNACFVKIQKYQCLFWGFCRVDIPYKDDIIYT